ncbi:MAG: ABC transporter permease [Planctomycetes bacterium]|nr:ABC transporter permease [Planctomycetota bacterium]
MPPEASVGTATRPALAVGANTRAPLGARLAAALSERAPALFVKELRQALRGRYLKVTLSIALALTLLAGVVVLGFVIPMSEGELRGFEGLILFGACFATTAFAAAGLVPFSAFSAMSAEADENTLELLQLSNLAPMRIVLGKLASAVLQAVLVCATVLPFAVIAWQLGGIPPSVLVLAPLFTVLGSACFSALGIALSSLTRVRWLRVVLMVLFGFFLFNAAQNVLLFAFVGAAAVYAPGAFSGPGGFPTGAVAGFGALGCVAFIAIAVAFAADFLAHREESGSTPLRRVTSVLALLGALATAIVTLAGGGGDEPVVMTGIVLGVLAAPLAWCCTEAEPLPLGARASPPRRGLLGWVELLHRAGGGRGALLATCVCGGVAASGAIASVLARGRWTDDASQTLAIAVYPWVYLLLPSALSSPWTGKTTVRVLARVLVFLFPWIAFLGTTLAMVFVVGPGERVVKNAANPFFVHDLVRKPDGAPMQLGHWAVLALVVLLTFALNARRMLRGVLEVRRAMRERDVREQMPEPAA